MAYAQNSAPHISAPGSTAGIYWKTTAALLPAYLFLIFLFPIKVLSLLVVTIAAAFFSEWLASLLFRKPLSFYNGNSVLMACLLVLLLPPDSPWALAALGSFFSIFVAKEILGGIGAYPFHPALMGKLFLALGFGNAVTGLPLMAQHPVLPALIAAGGIFLVVQKLIFFEMPVIYFSVFSFLIYGPQFQDWIQPASAGTLFAAFFILQDTTPLPLTRLARRLFALAAAALGAASPGISGQGTYAAILILSALTPWLDVWLKPRGARLAAQGDFS